MVDGTLIDDTQRPSHTQTLPEDSGFGNTELKFLRIDPKASPKIQINFRLTLILLFMAPSVLAKTNSSSRTPVSIIEFLDQESYGRAFRL